MSRASLTIVSSSAAVMVKCGEERGPRDQSLFNFRRNSNAYSNTSSSSSSPLTTPEPGVDLRCVSHTSMSSDEDSDTWRCMTPRSKCCQCCSECYDDEAISLFYELQLENPQSKTVYRKQSSEELVAMSDLFDEEPINARVVAKTIPTNRPPPLPPIPIASINYSPTERRVLYRIRSATQTRSGSRRGSLAIVDELLHQINNRLGQAHQRKRRFSSWDSDNGSTSSFSSSSKSFVDFALETFTAKQLEVKSE